MRNTEVPQNLTHLLIAQAPIYAQALAELRAGAKRSHWMWFIFPQLAGLGQSEMSRRYAIQDLDEARAYLAHPVLGARLVECAEAVVGIEVQGRPSLAALGTGLSAPTVHTAPSAMIREIMGTPDDLKLRSCATLFALMSHPGSIFHKLLDKYYGGMQCSRTHELVLR